MVSAVLEMKHIAKSFSGNKVLLDMDLTIEEGEVHALLGENGAGKSTLIKILGGIYTKDAGSIFINGREVQIHSAADARDNGISIIHQELMLARHMTIAENIFMGREQKKAGGFVDLARQETETQRFLDQYGIKLKADTRLDRLTIAQQQMVEIIRAVSFGSRIIVMDEPTSSLSDAEVDILYGMIRILKEQKVSIIYISHRLNELYDIADRTTVLRDGEHVGTVRMKDTERAGLIAMMVGRDLESYYTKNDNAKDEVVLEVKGLSDGKRVKKVSFDLRKGEILGVSGLLGAGRSETVECLFGIRRKVCGTVRFKGREVDFRNPREAMANGFGLVPESRKEQGLFLQSGVRFNTTINVVSGFLKHFIWNRQAEDDIVEGKIDDMHIRVTGPEQVVGKLSGGNQQKVLIGRWLCSTQSVLILDEPTRGVDVKTKSEIYALIDQLAASGMSIIMVSSELPEIINMSDRVLVMCNGYSTGILNRDELTQERIMTLATTEIGA
ncbi:sugar ABC transporter ATP-binding protein [Enterocloster clostridioformis]|uniref:sugar ABC transporter ATP-binding protein n=1 Tax=Enterocloster clostridioformis TaxID=1531 RepID=UPI0026764F74|nr:sugar ABC transporter ATP-binding protein [Enterocloster clostridioformis]